MKKLKKAWFWKKNIKKIKNILAYLRLFLFFKKIMICDIFDDDDFNDDDHDNDLSSSLSSSKSSSSHNLIKYIIIKVLTSY